MSQTPRGANHATLLAFSRGKLNYHGAMQALKQDYQEDLFLLMAQTHLPMLHLPQAETGRMKKALHELLAAD
jgi:hypothetical protein